MQAQTMAHSHATVAIPVRTTHSQRQIGEGVRRLLVGSGSVGRSKMLIEPEEFDAHTIGVTRRRLNES
jgi:hypothetical protein